MLRAHLYFCKPQKVKQTTYQNWYELKTILITFWTVCDGTLRARGKPVNLATLGEGAGSLK